MSRRDPGFLGLSPTAACGANVDAQKAANVTIQDARRLPDD
jgi:hypothetical protein